MHSSVQDDQITLQYSKSSKIFKYPIKPPPPNVIQDGRTKYQVLLDMISILENRPKQNFKFYQDLLLRRDSSSPDIDENGIIKHLKKLGKKYRLINLQLTKWKKNI